MSIYRVAVRFDYETMITLHATDSQDHSTFMENIIVDSLYSHFRAIQDKALFESWFLSSAEIEVLEEDKPDAQHPGAARISLSPRDSHLAAAPPEIKVSPAVLLQEVSHHEYSVAASVVLAFNARDPDLESASLLARRQLLRLLENPHFDYHSMGEEEALMFILRELRLVRLISTRPLE